MDDSQRAEAMRRVKAKRDFRNHAAVYVTVNLLLVGIWALSGGGAFWPGWSIVGWGVGLAFHGWGTYADRPITEADVEREIHKGG